MHDTSKRWNGGIGRVNLAMLQAAERRLLVQTYDRNPLLLESGHGVYLVDADGQEYLDLLSGIGVSALGYGHPAMLAAIAAQSERLIHTSNLFYHEGTAEMALRLTEISGLDRVFFTNSGTEAWEAALKLARAFAQQHTAPGMAPCTRFLALEHSFHGRSMGSVATTHKEKYRLPFMPVMPDVDFVRFNDVADLRRKFTSDVCAICIETVQGEGGIHPVSQEFLRTAGDLTREADALLIADEIQSGLGRTGRWFAYQHFDVLPDVVTVAKPIAGGLPMGAMLCTDRAASAFSPGMHGTTFGGSPLACAVGIAVLDAIRNDGLLDHVAEVGSYFLAGLRDLAQRHNTIREVRGLGLMIGVELSSADLAREVVTEMLERHIILNRTSETVLRFLPPFILDRSHVDVALKALDEVLTNASSTHPAHTEKEEFHE